MGTCWCGITLVPTLTIHSIIRAELSVHGLQTNEMQARGPHGDKSPTLQNSKQKLMKVALPLQGLEGYYRQAGMVTVASLSFQGPVNTSSRQKTAI